MTKTAAIRTARKAISDPIGHGTSWHLYGPYHSTEAGLSGHSTEQNADSYWKAKAMRTRWVAYLALVLMGWDSQEADMATDSAIGSVDEIINNALNK